VSAAEERETSLFLFPFEAGAMFCVFLIKHECWQRVGRFDESFWPGYFEDDDYHRRMKLIGIEEFQVPDTDYYHHVSATLKTLSPTERGVQSTQFVRNREYYIHKWGGLPGRETLSSPNLSPTRPTLSVVASATPVATSPTKPVSAPTPPTQKYRSSKMRQVAPGMFIATGKARGRRR
jgi:hypothetical protein